MRIAILFAFCYIHTTYPLSWNLFDSDIIDQSQNVSNLHKGSLCYALVFMQPSSNCISTLKQTEVCSTLMTILFCSIVSQIIHGANKYLELQIYVILLAWFFALISVYKATNCTHNHKGHAKHECKAFTICIENYWVLNSAERRQKRNSRGKIIIAYNKLRYVLKRCHL